MINTTVTIDELLVHDQPRKQQSRVYQLLMDNWHDYQSFIISMPTGSGKSDLAAAIISNYYQTTIDKDDRLPTDIIIPTISHQQQWLSIMNSYSKKDDYCYQVALLKGRSNYYCPKASNHRADRGPCLFNHLCEIDCPLKKARRKIRVADIRILNWWVYKSLSFNQQQTYLKIFDEAHNLLSLEELYRLTTSREELLAIVTVNDDQRLVNQLKKDINSFVKKAMGSRRETLIAGQRVIVFWSMIIDYLVKAEELVTDVITDLIAQGKKHYQLGNHYYHLYRLKELRMAIEELIIDLADNQLVIVFRKTGLFDSELMITSQPFTISNIYQRLFSNSEKNIFLSATIGDGDYLAKTIGLPKNSYLVIKEESSFPPVNHPFVILTDSQRLSTKDKEQKKITYCYLKKKVRPFLTIV